MGVDLKKKEATGHAVPEKQDLQAIVMNNLVSCIASRKVKVKDMAQELGYPATLVSKWLNHHKELGLTTSTLNVLHNWTLVCDYASEQVRKFRRGLETLHGYAHPDGTITLRDGVTGHRVEILGFTMNSSGSVCAVDSRQRMLVCDREMLTLAHEWAKQCRIKRPVESEVLKRRGGKNAGKQTARD